MGKPRQTSAVYDAIIARIDAGTLLPGDQIDERDLMEACAVSRTPVREALIQLEADGLVLRHARKGVRLFQPSAEEFLAILEVHATLEAHATELAARRISPEAACDLRNAVAACTAFAARGDSARKDHSAYYALNMTFHEVIAEASCNPFLIDMIKLNARKLMAYYRLRYRIPGTIEMSAREHAEIADQVLSQNADAARRAMLSHFNYERETVMHMLASVRPLTG